MLGREIKSRIFQRAEERKLHEVRGFGSKIQSDRKYGRDLKEEEEQLDKMSKVIFHQRVTTQTTGLAEEEGATL